MNNNTIILMKKGLPCEVICKISKEVDELNHKKKYCYVMKDIEKINEKINRGLNCSNLWADFFSESSIFQNVTIEMNNKLILFK